MLKSHVPELSVDDLERSKSFSYTSSMPFKHFSVLTKPSRFLQNDVSVAFDENALALAEHEQCTAQ